jgi:hypothetical protein
MPIGIWSIEIVALGLGLGMPNGGEISITGYLQEQRFLGEV